MNHERIIHIEKTEKESISRKLWESLKEMVKASPVLVAGILGFAIGKHSK